MTDPKPIQARAKGEGQIATTLDPIPVSLAIRAVERALRWRTE